MKWWVGTETTRAAAWNFYGNGNIPQAMAFPNLEGGNWPLRKGTWPFLFNSWATEAANFVAQSHEGAELLGKAQVFTC